MEIGIVLMNYFSLCSALLSFGLLLLSCSPFAQGLIRVNGSNAGRTIQIQSTDKLEVVLEANPSTGYVWSVASVEEHVLKQISMSEFAPSSKSIGSPGLITLIFEAVGKGQTLLKLAYRRPWEKNIAPLKTFEVTVVVK